MFLLHTFTVDVTGTLKFNVNISLNKSQTSTGVATFTDIANYSWATEAIMALAEKGIIKGISDTSFAPANQIKRADYILSIVRMLGVTAELEGNFGDAKKSLSRADYPWIW